MNLDIALGILLILIALIIFSFFIKKYFEGSRFEKGDIFGKSAFYDLIGLALVLIMLGIYFLF